MNLSEQDHNVIWALCRVNKEWDYHKMVASYVIQVPYDEITPAQRAAVKLSSYHYTYGSGPGTLLQGSGS